MATIEELMRDAFERDRLSRASPQAQAWQSSRGTTMAGSPAPGAPQATAPAAPAATGRIATAARNVAGKFGGAAGIAGRTIGGVAATDQLSKGVNMMRGNQPSETGYDKTEGAARTGVGALGALGVFKPAALRGAGAYGMGAAAMLSGLELARDYVDEKFGKGAFAKSARPEFMNLIDWIRGRGQGAAAPAQPAPAATATAAPQTATAAPQTATAAPQTATAALPDWFNTPEAAAMNTAQGPVSQGPVSQGPVSRRAASQSAQQRVAQLQQMAGQELMRPQEIARPPVAEVGAGDQGKATINKVGMAYGGDPMHGNVERPVYGLDLPAWDGGNSPSAVKPGQTEIIRGLYRNTVNSNTGITTPPELPAMDGFDTKSLFAAWQQSAGNDDPRVAAFHKSLGEMLGVQARQEAATELARLTNEGRLAEQQERSRATLGSAATQAGAAKYVADRGLEGRSAQTEVPVLDESGNQVLDAARQPVFRKVGVGYDAKSGRWKPLVSEGLQPGRTLPGYTPEQTAQAIAKLKADKGYTDDQAWRYLQSKLAK